MLKCWEEKGISTHLHLHLDQVPDTIPRHLKKISSSLHHWEAIITMIILIQVVASNILVPWALHPLHCFSKQPPVSPQQTITIIYHPSIKITLTDNNLKKVTPVQRPYGVLLHPQPRPLKHQWLQWMISRNINVSTATNGFNDQVVYLTIVLSIRIQNHSSVASAICVFLESLTLVNTWLPIPDQNRTSVKYVENDSANRRICWLIRDAIPEFAHIPVVYAGRLSTGKLMSEDMLLYTKITDCDCEDFLSVFFK